MTYIEFKNNQYQAREQLLKKIIEGFKKINPVAIYQFGSGVNNYQDEFSDIDLWITFSDTSIPQIKSNRKEIFASIDSVLVESDAPQNAPSGGTYTLVIYDTAFGLFHVDYYLSPVSGNKIRTDAKLLYGDDSLPRGEWVLERHAKGKWTAEHVLDQAIAMAFILNKAIIRGVWNETHADYIRTVYKDFGEVSHHVLPLLPNGADFDFILQLYENLDLYSNDKQRKAIMKLKEYTEIIKKLYS